MSGFCGFRVQGGLSNSATSLGGLMDFTHITNYTIMILRVVEVEYNDWLPNNTQGETSRKPVLDIPVRIVHPHDACAGLCMEQIKMTNRDVQSTKGTAVCV